MFGWIASIFGVETKDSGSSNMTRSSWDKKANKRVYKEKSDYPHTTHDLNGSHYSTGRKMGNRHFETKANGKPDWGKEVNSKGGRKRK
jgi:hypothetical protein